MVNATAGRMYQAYDCIVYCEARLLCTHCQSPVALKLFFIHRFPHTRYFITDHLLSCHVSHID